MLTDEQFERVRTLIDNGNCVYPCPTCNESGCDECNGTGNVESHVLLAPFVEPLFQEVERFRALINTPRTDDFFNAVRHEAAHQIERWGVEHDAGKRREDWIALLVYLTGKATKAHYDGNAEKLKHHVVTVAAVCLNWLRAENGESNAMRPGVA